MQPKKLEKRRKSLLEKQRLWKKNKGIKKKRKDKEEGKKRKEEIVHQVFLNNDNLVEDIDNIIFKFSIYSFKEKSTCTQTWKSRKKSSIRKFKNSQCPHNHVIRHKG